MTRFVGVLAIAAMLGACGGSKSEAPVPKAPGSQDSASKLKAAAPGSFTSQDVEYPAPDGREIGATVTIPDDGGKHPAILMIAGSGPTDRDWGNPMMQGPAKSGRMLAELLSKSGYVVLRYDKMGTGVTPIPEVATFDGYRDEAGAGLLFLRAHEAVDPARIYVAGHSEGGLHALRLANAKPEAIAGVVLLSSPGTSLREILGRQLRDRMTEQGLSADQVQTQLELLDQVIGAFLAGEDAAAPEELVPGLKMLAAQLTNPAAADLSRGLLGYDPSEGIETVQDPVLIVNGGKDLQVDPELDAKTLHAAAKSAGVDSTLHVAPEADHALKHEELDPQQLRANPSQLATRYNEEGRQLDPEITQPILDWLAAH